MSSSDSESNRSASPSHSQGPVSTPGRDFNRSRSNSPEYDNRSQAETQESGRSRSTSPARSGSAASSRSKSGSRSRSNSPESNKSEGSRRSESPGSRKSRSRSGTPAKSVRSESHRSASSDSHHSGSNRSRSQSAASNRSRSASQVSNRSRSAGSNRSRSRSKSPQSARSRSESPGSNRSRSRSKSVGSNRSASVGSNKSKDRDTQSQDRSRSQSALEIVEDRSPQSEKGEKRKRDSSEEKETKRKSKVIDSDSEPEANEASAAALFGDADDISSEDEEKDRKQPEEEDIQRHSGDEGEEEQHARRSDEENEAVPEEDEDKENEPIPETRIDVEIPKISCDLGRDIHFVKLPNFLSVDTRPFDQETYEDEIDEEETLDEEGRARLKLKVENTIRWREVVDNEGNVLKESNARLVKWSDGSFSLHLGSEIFDVYKQPLQGDHNHLFIRQGTGLQGQAVFRTKLSFRPHSTESFTHRKMTLSLADRSQKTSGIKILSQVGVDPDQDRKTLLKKEEEKLRHTVRAKPRKRGEGPPRTHVGSNAYREEEGSDEDGAISLNAIKNKYKGGAAINKGGAIYSSDEEGSDFETRRGRKQDKAKALKDSESSEDTE